MCYIYIYARIICVLYTYMYIYSYIAACIPHTRHPAYFPHIIGIMVNTITGWGIQFSDQVSSFRLLIYSYVYINIGFGFLKKAPQGTAHSFSAKLFLSPLHSTPPSLTWHLSSECVILSWFCLSKTTYLLKKKRSLELTLTKEVK